MGGWEWELNCLVRKLNCTFHFVITKHEISYGYAVLTVPNSCNLIFYCFPHQVDLSLLPCILVVHLPAFLCTIWLTWPGHCFYLACPSFLRTSLSPSLVSAVSSLRWPLSSVFSPRSIEVCTWLCVTSFAGFSFVLLTLSSKEKRLSCPCLFWCNPECDSLKACLCLGLSVLQDVLCMSSWPSAVVSVFPQYARLCRPHSYHLCLVTLLLLHAPNFCRFGCFAADRYFFAYLWSFQEKK